MHRLLMVVALGAIVCLLGHDAQAMKKLSQLGVSKDSVTAGALLAKKRGTPSLSTDQLQTMKRRIMTARTSMDRIHVTGSIARQIPPEALDAVAEWKKANGPDVEIWYDSDWGTPFFIKGKDLTLAPATPLAKAGKSTEATLALGTFSRLPNFLGLLDCASELRQIDHQTDHLGMTHVRFQQTYQGYDVWARDLYVHYDQDGNMSLINGRWSPTPNSLDQNAISVTEDDAIAVVKRTFADRDSIDIVETELMVYIDEDQEPHWAWRVRTSLGLTEGYDLFVEATSGNELTRVSTVYSDGPVEGSGVDLLGFARTLDLWQEGSSYFMINTTKDMYIPDYFNSNWGNIIVYDYSFPWLPASSPNKDSWSNAAAVSAFANLEVAYDYLREIHGIVSFDNNGRSMRATVNHPIPDANGNNAYFDGVSKQLVFGTGDGTTHRNLAAGIDIIGHEIGHGVIDATAGLVYLLQPGAINESYADIFGTMSEYHMWGEQGNWRIGEDVITPSIAGDAIRNMSDPHNGGTQYGDGRWQPETMSEYVDLTIWEDHGGVHVNSGRACKYFCVSGHDGILY